MKLLPALLVMASLCFFKMAAEKNSVSVDGKDFDHGDFDQELLMGEDRKKLHELSPEEATKEIRKLVGRMDANEDGKLNKEEILAWIKKVDDQTYKTEADQLFTKEDSNGDGFISLQEYWADSEGEDFPEDLNDAHEALENRFNEADTDKDGRLDKKEFAPFIHPFRYDNMVGHLVEDQLALYDKNRDGMISMEEFTNSLNPDGLPEDELPEWVETERFDFKERLDRNHDGVLNTEEMNEWLAPNDRKFFDEEADHLLGHADKNKDGFLTVEEVEAEFDMFADSPVTDYGHVLHEEL